MSNSEGMALRLRLWMGIGVGILWALAAVFSYLTYAVEQGKPAYAALAGLSLVLAGFGSVLSGRQRAMIPHAPASSLQSIPIQWESPSFLREVEKRSSTKLSACYQCHKCSSGCPIGQDAELSSSQIMRLIHLGAEQEVLSSQAIWLCASCQACSARCPMGVDVAAVMDALRIMASQRAGAGQHARGSLFGVSFLNSVRRHGRAYELGLMVSYKLRTGDLFSDIDKAPSMFAKGKLSLLPKRSRDEGKVRQIFKRGVSEEVKR